MNPALIALEAHLRDAKALREKGTPGKWSAETGEDILQFGYMTVYQPKGTGTQRRHDARLAAAAVNDYGPMVDTWLEMIERVKACGCGHKWSNCMLCFSRIEALTALARRLGLEVE